MSIFGFEICLSIQILSFNKTFRTLRCAQYYYISRHSLFVCNPNNITYPKILPFIIFENPCPYWISLNFFLVLLFICSFSFEILKEVLYHTYEHYEKEWQIYCGLAISSSHRRQYLTWIIGKIFTIFQVIRSTH